MQEARRPPARLHVHAERRSRAARTSKAANESLPYPKHFEAYYPETKAKAEKAVLAANGPDLATVALRPHLICGPGDPHLIPRIIDAPRKGKLRRIGSQPLKVDVTYIDNAAEAHLDAADRLDIGTAARGQGVLHLQRRAGGVVGVHRPHPRRGRRAAGDEAACRRGRRRLAGRVLEWVYRLVPFLPGEPPMTRFVASQLSTSHWYDISAARRDLGYEPKVSVEEGLKRLGERLRARADRLTIRIYISNSHSRGRWHLGRGAQFRGWGDPCASEHLDHLGLLRTFLTVPTARRSHLDPVRASFPFRSSKGSEAGSGDRATRERSRSPVENGADLAAPAPAG